MSSMLKAIGDLVSKCETWNPAYKGQDDFEYIDLSSVDKDAKVISATEVIPCSEAPSRARQIVKEGDVLVSTVRPNLNGVAKVEGRHTGATASTGFCVLRPNPDSLDTNYLFHWVKSPAFIQRMVDVASGANYPAVSDKKVKGSPIPVPPLEEQKRIAEILDAADALRAKRRESLAQLESLLQSTFLDMFGDPASCESQWDRCVLGDVVEFAKDGPHVSPEYSEEGIPFLSARHVRPGKIIWEDLKHVSQEEAQRQWKKCRPQEGDILYTKGGTTGVAATVTTPEPFAIWVHVALLRPLTNLVHPMWLEAMLNTEYCYQQSQKYTHGIANRDLGLKRMVKIDMYLPPLELQTRFVGVAKRILRERQRYLDHLGELNSLFLSLQSRAFVGEA
ncbi:restriction endonuclease subunit S [Marinobacter sediminum]|uniref:restriction endonuclease subunit S n=1 Tax=Marinobacter sediminum TaxID=256323 RepID=UPI00202E9A37|nr:restriction endonuclease subunit S [Marinobacter sediminum]MCM0613721.1 restriction endonuclease subunit S [Marinobacter sediminum]